MHDDKLAADVFAMDVGTWQRHANPWSVWTRIPILAVFVVVVWSRVWLGWWVLLPLAAVAAWTWWNPRAFAPPAHTDTWSSKSVFGERLWLNRAAVPVPARHVRVAHLLLAVSALGVAPLSWGLLTLDVWPTLFGMVVMYSGKLWFLDRMVWLYEDMKDGNPAYRAWLR